LKGAWTKNEYIRGQKSRHVALEQDSKGDLCSYGSRVVRPGSDRCIVGELTNATERTECYGVIACICFSSVSYSTVHASSSPVAFSLGGQLRRCPSSSSSLLLVPATSQLGLKCVFQIYELRLGQCATTGQVIESINCSICQTPMNETRLTLSNGPCEL
jgi:hypothetical protein